MDWTGGVNCRLSDDVDEDFLDGEEEEWEDACCEDPYDEDEDEDDEKEWCD